MGDTVENNQVNSCSYEDYSDLGAPLSTPLASAPAEPAVDLTATRPDNYSEPLRLPIHLSAHDSIRISDGQGGSRTLELVELVREARSDAGARAQLLTLAQAAAANPQVLNSCYVASEENLLPILAQLASDDLTARREGALTLKQLILSNPEDRRLQQGLLATVDQIARQNPQNQEARQLLVSLAQDRSPQNEGLRQWMQSHTAVASYSSNVAMANPSGASRALASAGGGSAPAAVSGATSRSAATETASGTSSLTAGQILALPGFAPLAALIEEKTLGTPLQGLAPESVIGFALTHTSLPVSQFQDLLYLRIMAAALPLNSFTGNLFGQSMIVAGNLAQDIRQHLAGTSAAPRAALASGESSSTSDAAPVLTLGSAIHPAPAPSASPVVENAGPSLFAASQGWTPTGIPAGFQFFVPALLTSLSGMQGLAYQPSVLGSGVLANQAFGFSNRSSDHIDGPTALDEDSHQGFGGDSQGQGSQGQEGHEDSSAPQDAYFA